MSSCGSKCREVKGRNRPPLSFSGEGRHRRIAISFPGSASSCWRTTFSRAGQMRAMPATVMPENFSWPRSTGIKSSSSSLQVSQTRACGVVPASVRPALLPLERLTCCVCLPPANRTTRALLHGIAEDRPQATARAAGSHQARRAKKRPNCGEARSRVVLTAKPAFFRCSTMTTRS